MAGKIQIALQIPYLDPLRNDRIFFLRLKQELVKERPIYKRTERTFVISDTGGDFLKFCKILYKGDVINRKLQWTFDDGRLVILGNCLDSNKDVLECLWLIYDLEEKAKKKGGYVHFLWGNNELIHINGDWRFRHPKYAVGDFSRDASTALFDGSNELWRWLKTKNMIERIGRILFVHGSVSADLLFSGLSIMQINNLARSYIVKPNHIFDAPSLADSFGEVLNAERDEKSMEAKVDQMLNHFSVKAIVTTLEGRQQIDILYRGKVVNVHSDHLNGQSEGLLIGKHRFYRVSKSEKPQRLL